MAVTLTNGVTGTLNFSGTSIIPTLTATAVGNTVNYTGVAQTIKATIYNNLTLSGSGTKTLGGATTVNDTATINAGVSLDVAGFTFSLSSATLVVNGTLDFSNANGSVMSTAATSVLTMGSSGVIRTIDANGVGPATNASLIATATFTTSSIDTDGTVEYYRSTDSTGIVTDRNYNNLTITGSTRTKTWTLAATRTINGNVTINSGAPFTLSGAQTVNVKGNWSNSGTFTAGASTINFNGATQTINNANTWYNLSVTGATARTVTLQSGVTQTVTNGLTLTGASGQLLTLVPSASPAKWQINVNALATQIINYVSSSYSDASGGTAINAADGTNTNGGNNTNWNFSYVATVTSGTFTVDSIANTITGVPFGISKADFLAALTKGQADQTWNDAGIVDPVVSTNVLVVTAQDGTTVVTYIITVNADPDIALLAAAKSAAHDALTNALDSYTLVEADYTPANFAILTGFKTAGDTAIDEATDSAGVTSAQNTATTGMAGVQTIAQTDAAILVAANIAVANYEAALITTPAEVTAAELLEVQANTAVALVTDVAAKADLEARIVAKKVFVDAAKAAFTEAELQAAALIAAETAVHAYEIAPVSTPEEVSAAEALKAPADDAVALVLDPTTRDAFALRILIRADAIALARTTLEAEAAAALALSNATNAVVTAETTPTQSNIDAAQLLVTLLPDGADKTDLQTRIDAVQATVNEVTDAAALADSKVTAHDALTVALLTYTEGNYTPANWTILTGFKTAGDAAINDATDLAGVNSAQNTATEGMAGVLKLATTQTIPNATTGYANSNSTTPEVVITNPTQSVEITIESGTTNPTINVSSFITGGTGILPEITINSANAGNASVEISAVTTVTSADVTWNGIIAAPTITTVTLPETSGETKTLSTAIEVGFTGAKLSFDKAVRILLPGQAGKRAGYIRTGIDFTEITSICAADNQAIGDALAIDGDCKIDIGSDLVIWTKHFTTFATYTQTSTPAPALAPSSGGGGNPSLGNGSGGLTAPTVPPQTLPAQTPPSQPVILATSETSQPPYQAGAPASPEQPTATAGEQPVSETAGVPSQTVAVGENIPEQNPTVSNQSLLMAIVTFGTGNWLYAFAFATAVFMLGLGVRFSYRKSLRKPLRNR